MNTRFAWKIAAPMIVLGLLLLALGVFAAWNVHEQHQTSSELIAREVRVVIAVARLQMEMREIRYQINIFLRTRDRRRLTQVIALNRRVERAMTQAKELLNEFEYEYPIIAEVEESFRRFLGEFARLTAGATREGHGVGPIVSELELGPEEFQALVLLTDHTMSTEVLEPLGQIVEHDEELVRTTNEESRVTAHHLRIGFLLLGICGGGAGLLMGMGIARAVWRSIVQFDVSVRTAVGKLADVTGPVTFSHTGDLAGLDHGLRGLEDHIAEVVERLNQRETELLRSEQLARVGQLAAGMAHELRNPLMPMKVLVQAALERGDERGGLRGRSLEIINEEISRLETSIQAFLDFARPPSIEKAPADLREIIRQTIELVGGRASQHFVEIQASLPEHPVTSRVDRSQIRQLLLNLFLNALDALPGGGLLEVSLRPRVEAPGLTSPPRAPVAETPIDSEHDALRLFSRHRAPPCPQGPEWLAITVADNGPGIPSDQLECIFTPFVTSKETGTGLGLSICQRIASAHQGLLTVANRPSGGAEFTLLIPLET